MGLNSMMPEPLPTRSSTPKMANNGSRKRGADPSSKSRRVPVRDDHPQEAELQRFKQEFAAKQHLDVMKQQLEEKKRKVRATLDKARLALSQGIIASSPKLGGKFEDSKEFLEALEFLQCNKDFIFQFLQQKPNAVFSDNGSTTPVTTLAKKGKQGSQGISQETQPAKATSNSSQRGFSPRSLVRLFMHSDSRKANDHNKQTSKPEICEGRATQSPTAINRPASGDLISDDVKRRTSTSTSSRYMLPTSPKSQKKHETKATDKKKGARDVIAEIKERLRRREHQPKENIHGTKKLPNSRKAHEPASSPKTNNFTLTKSSSTGKRISMLRPDLDDNEDITTPKTMLSDYLTDSLATLQDEGRKTKTKTSSVKASETSHQKPNTTQSSSGKLDSPSTKHFLHSVNDAASSPNLARCRSVPNSAYYREHKRSTTGVDVAQNATTPKTARNTQNGTQNGNKRMLRLFSVGSKKGNKAGHETPEAMPALVPSPSRAAPLAESCVSECNPLSKEGKDAKTKVRRNILDHVEVGRDATSDSNGRDSVLEPPFHEFKDITNAHQAPLRIRLRRPKWDASTEIVDTIRDLPRDTLRSSEVPPKPHTPQVTPKTPSPPPPQSLSPPLSPASTSDFAFVRDILVASGFHTHGGRTITEWHSATQPISPYLLKRMQSTTRSSHHRLLFDAINEILVTNLERRSSGAGAGAGAHHHCYGLPIVRALPLAAGRIGRRFVEEVWGEIRKRAVSIETSSDDSFLHSLVAQEVRPTSEWLSLRKDVDRIGWQVEKVVWEELVEELCRGLLPV